ncbi:cadmium-translocating P-type ATPase [Candidatus Woesearchaeota archaeon]|nr:cadmium-translocating P-type ATPase [Candidatus Woesearchaeota archaeon]
MRDNNHEKSCSTCATDIFEEKKPLWKQKKILIILISGIILGIGLYLEFLTEQHLSAQILFLAVVIVSGYSIIMKGILSVWKRQLDMNFLMSIAAIGAFLIGHGEEGAAVILLFFLAEFLEDYAADRARKSISSLLKLVPETATVKRKGKENNVHVHEIGVGEIIIVKPGDRIPLDGAVVSGFSSVNQAPITGESMPVSKTKGSEVFAGTINEEGYLEIKVTKRSDETTISKIIKFVEQAQKQKSKTEAFIDKFAIYYTPVVIILAFLTLVIPILAFNQPFGTWFYRALVLLVVSCPCALAISTPISMVSGITSAARNGVLIKAGNYIEEIKNVKVVVFDKTGTLTEGKPEVTDIVALNKYPENEILKIAASLESKSKHPIAEAIIRNSGLRKIKFAKVSEFKSIAGRGIKGKIRNKWFYIGNKTFFKENKIGYPDKEINKLENDGKTTVLVGNSNQIIGIIAQMDKIRGASYSTVKELKEKGIKTVMLTGDNEEVARAVSKKLAIDECYPKLLPEEKVEIVEKLTREYEHVVMIGDGVNDAPALAKAHVSIAMGAIGSDVAIETADIALMHDDLSKVNYLIGLSRKTMSVVKQNVSASILIKCSFAILAFPGIIPLWMAVVVGDMGLSLAVILNALRIGRKNKKQF